MRLKFYFPIGQLSRLKEKLWVSVSSWCRFCRKGKNIVKPFHFFSPLFSLVMSYFSNVVLVFVQNGLLDPWARVNGFRFSMVYSWGSSI